MAELVTKQELGEELGKFRLEFQADIAAAFERNNKYLIEQFTNMFDHLSDRLHKVELVADEIHIQTKILQKVLLRIETHENRIDEHDGRLKKLENVPAGAKAGRAIARK